jgi:hypothetical protein
MLRKQDIGWNDGRVMAEHHCKAAQQAGQPASEQTSQQ